MRLKILLPLFLIILLMGCAQLGLKSPQDMTPQEKALWMTNVYNAQYDSYLEWVAKPDLTEKQKDILRIQKEILVEVEEPLELYTKYIEQGALPPGELEAFLIKQLNRLMMESL